MENDEKGKNLEVIVVSGDTQVILKSSDLNENMDALLSRAVNSVFMLTDVNLRNNHIELLKTVAPKVNK